MASGAHDLHRSQHRHFRRAKQATPMPPPPREHLVGVHTVSPSHHRDRRASRECLLNDPTLQIKRPPPSSRRLNRNHAALRVHLMIVGTSSQIVQAVHTGCVLWEGLRGMIGVDKIGEIRRAYFEQARSGRSCARFSLKFPGRR